MKSSRISLIFFLSFSFIVLILDSGCITQEEEEVNITLIDLDGTLINTKGRVDACRYVNDSGINYSCYFSCENLEYDAIYLNAVEAVEEVGENSTVIYFTARPEYMKNCTIEFLENAGFPKGDFYIRNEYEKTKDFKIRVLDSISGPNVRITIIDNEMKRFIDIYENYTTVVEIKDSIVNN